MIRNRMARCGAGALMSAALLTLPASVPAKIDLVTLPARDTTQLTIYQDEDLTLVRETRALTFNEGRNDIQFSWAGTLIDPTSVQIRVVTSPRDFKILDARYPARTSNTVIWTIEAENEGAADIEISYFASGLRWRADYTAVASSDETRMRLEPNFTIFNESGEDFQRAETRLVVGEINLVEAIEDLARRGIVPEERAEEMRRVVSRAVLDHTVAFDMAAAPAMMREAAAEIVREAISEYHLYHVEGKEDLVSGWGKQLPNPRVDDIPIEVSYEYNPGKHGDRVVKFYKFRNDSDHELGDDPIPGGRFYVYSDDGRDGLRFEGTHTNDYVPIGEEVELLLGSDGLVLFENRLMSTQRRNLETNVYGDVTGHETVSVFEYEIRNSRTSTVPVKVTLPFSGDWEITDSTHDYRRVDAQTAEWELEVTGLGKETIRIELLERHGSRGRVTPPVAGPPRPMPGQPTRPTLPTQPTPRR